MYEPRLQNCQNQETDGQICVKFHNVQKMSNRCESWIWMNAGTLGMLWNAQWLFAICS